MRHGGLDKERVMICNASKESVDDLLDNENQEQQLRVCKELHLSSKKLVV